MRLRKTYTTTPRSLEQVCRLISTEEVGMVFAGNGWRSDGSVLAGFGILEHAPSGHIDQLLDWLKQKEDYVFCHLSYDVKNLLEPLRSNAKDHIEFPWFNCFIPSIVLSIKDQSLTVYYHEHDSSAKQNLRQIEDALRMEDERQLVSQSAPVSIPRDTYLSDIQRLQDHFQRGDIYQANYCQSFLWEEATIDGASLFAEGFDKMPNPFSVYYKSLGHEVLSWSPECFLRFDGNKVTSQPMKGTAPRGSDPEEDQAFVEQLRGSEKDRRENVMIVDLVRNDLSHFAQKGSVKVPELYTIETYPKVHQMHSTVVATLRDDIHPFQALLKAFPMGSMTGAPKFRAMQILDDVEHTRRGIFSGTIGFFTPERDGNFNVVIRTLVYNKESKVLQAHAGGGITALSDPEAEYQESLVKIAPIMELLGINDYTPTPFLPLEREGKA